MIIIQTINLIIVFNPKHIGYIEQLAINQSIVSTITCRDAVDGRRPIDRSTLDDDIANKYPIDRITEDIHRASQDNTDHSPALVRPVGAPMSTCASWCSTRVRRHSDMHVRFKLSAGDEQVCGLAANARQRICWLAYIVTENTRPSLNLISLCREGRGVACFRDTDSGHMCLWWCCKLLSTWRFELICPSPHFGVIAPHHPYGQGPGLLPDSPPILSVKRVAIFCVV